MRRGVDAARHSAGDGEPGVGQVGREPFRDGEAVGSGPPGAHHSDSQRLQQLDAAAREQQHRRIENFAQPLRITRVPDGYGDSAGRSHLFLLRGGVFERASAGDRLRHGAA